MTSLEHKTLPLVLKNTRYTYENTEYKTDIFSLGLLGINKKNSQSRAA